MANNYKVKNFSNSTTNTSQVLFEASASTTLVKSIIVNCDKTTPNAVATLKIKKSGGAEELIRRVTVTSRDVSTELLYDVLPLESGDKLYATSDDTDLNFMMSWVENNNGIIGAALDSLTDVDTTGVANGDVLTYNSTSGNWEPEAPAAGGDIFKTIAVAGQSSIVADSSTDTLTIAAGTGITLTTDAGTDTLTITNSATGANAFGNVAVAGQTTVEADSTGDTLTLVAGTGVTITTNATTDTVTITNSVTAPNSFDTITVAGQSSVVAESSSDTLALVAAGGMTITTNATTDTITLDSARLDDDNVTLSGVRTVNLNGENFYFRNNSDTVIDMEPDVIKMCDVNVQSVYPGEGAFMRLWEASSNGLNYVGFKAPASLAASTSWILPSADGTNAQVLQTNGSGTLSFASLPSAPNTFGTIAVSGQSNVVADSSTDTLTLVAGTNVTITTNASTDSITIAATGGGATSPAGSNGQIQYNASGSFGAEAALFYDATNNRLSVGGDTSPTATMEVRGAGTTTGLSLRTEDSGGTARFEVMDRGTVTITEQSTVASNTVTLDLVGSKAEYWRPSIRMINTTFSNSVAQNIGGNNVLNIQTHVGAVPSNGGLTQLAASAGGNCFTLGGYQGSTTPTADVVRFFGAKTTGVGSGTQNLAASDQIMAIFNNATQRFTLLGSGSMGILNTAPTSTTSLTVRGQGTGTNETIRVENSSGTARFVVRDDGGYSFAGGTVGLAQTGYTTFTNLTTDRTCDANATTVEELADILGTLIVDLKTKGIISA
jgi:uncharacterized protein YdeI (BOF family)